MATDRYIVTLAADGHGPPAALRLRHWLKLARRCHGLRCDGVAAVPDVPTGGMAVTNPPNQWRPRGRALRPAVGSPAKGRRAAFPASVGPVGHAARPAAADAANGPGLAAMDPNEARR
jgi:hypothetical protein